MRKECVGHVQKRLGTRLRTFRINLKGNILIDRKETSGGCKLTDKVINSMQTYYGMAIHQDSNDLFAMTTTLIHKTNFDDAETRHRHCPKNIASWCKKHIKIM